MLNAQGCLPQRACLSLMGGDCIDFLDKLITQSVRDLAPGVAAYGALLSPQGKIGADFFIWRTEAGFLLDIDATRLELLHQRLSRFRLRADVAFAPRADLAIVLYADLPPAGALMAGPDPRLANFGGPKLGGPNLGGRAVMLAGDAPAPCPAITLLNARIEAGLPDLAQDGAADEIFALEGLLDELNGVSFKKGCFPGQENVSRMKRRATTRKKFCRLRFEGPAPPLGAALHAGEAELGALRAIGQGTALAFLRLDRALAARHPLSAAGIALRLDPPEWLILPPVQDDDGALES